MIDYIDKYRIEKLLGRGGMGEVYLAVDLDSNTNVAVKTFHVDLDDTSQRIDQEIKALFKLRHRNIVKMLDFGNESGMDYIVFEYASTGTLTDLMKNHGGKLHPEKAVELIYQITLGLCFAHDKGIIHRDIKPENILINDFGDPVLTDFGIVKFQNQSSVSSGLTVTNTALGSPHYIAPEQAMNAKNVSKQSDIYSLGASFYHILTGFTPFSSEECSPVQVMLKHIQERLIPPNKRYEEISHSLNSVILKMMEKNPENRYRNCSELILDLELLRDDLYAQVNCLQDYTENTKALSSNKTKLLISSLIVAIVIPLLFILFSDKPAPPQKQSPDAVNRVSKVGITTETESITELPPTNKKTKEVRKDPVLSEEEPPVQNKPTTFRNRVTKTDNPAEIKIGNDNKASRTQGLNRPINKARQQTLKKKTNYVNKDIAAQSKDIDQLSKWMPFDSDSQIFTNRTNQHWKDIPNGFNGWSFTQNMAHRGISNFQVKNEGTVYLLVTDRWGGGGSINPQLRQEMITQREFLNLGWQVELPVNTKEGHTTFTVYSKYCKAGEILKYRTEKYIAPMLLEKK
ncbi:Serine/threonine protein kinase, Pkn2 family protein [Lentisphaera araneosa HTCC2155]|uniref:Serine/threonine protein kinase, Pkn2 family protein n=1 Tax=Lentisphaera araneosa HTCC2155 TaxID=313628 RepID=A6DII6_9BACT|nr:serine/threonine-protein kinase [Lentisphaera araneosa]EDM28272.1 Serine/threonine protein kinase, Pkn2 family protein [Lentisphaera araneosa HTCC2155]